MTKSAYLPHLGLAASPLLRRLCGKADIKISVANFAATSSSGCRVLRLAGPQEIVGPRPNDIPDGNPGVLPLSLDVRLTFEK
jgi:hypothetical protein